MGSDDLNTLLHFLSTNRPALWALQSGDKEGFNDQVREGARRYNVVLRDNAEPIRLIGTWVTNSSCPEVLKSALLDYRRQKQQTRRQRMNFLTRTRLYMSPGLQIRNRSTMRIITVKSNKTSYPPYGTIIADTRGIYNKWYPHFVHGKQADSRLKRLPLQILDVNRLQKDIGPTESVVIKDESGHLVGFVLRNFCPDEALLQWATQVAKMQIPVRRNIRKEDTGKLVLMGYSAGSRSKTAFDWVRNITKKMSDEQKAASDMAGSVLFAVAWQLMKSQVPQEVIDDFNDFVKALGIRRMDKEAGGNGGKADVAPRDSGDGKVKVSIRGVEQGRGRLGLAVGEEEFEFDNVELAPPSGVVGQNYSRAIHREHHPHKWAVSWTMERSPNAKGSDFFLANVGVRIQQESNTAIAWRPACNHGTSLPDCDPADAEPHFRQTGLAFVTSNRLAGAWRKYQAGLITKEEGAREVEGEDVVEEDSG